MGTEHKVQIIVNGNPYLVEVADLTASPMTVVVNGTSYQVETAADPAVPAATSAARPAVVVPKRVVQPQASSQAASNVSGVTAPMPGIIINILVNVGDKVSKDQVLCMLEAMKMQNAIRAPRDGEISEVAVSAGQSVGHGDLLFAFA